MYFITARLNDRDLARVRHQLLEDVRADHEHAGGDRADRDQGDGQRRQRQADGEAVHGVRAARYPVPRTVAT